jgi:hypothetical protein
MGNYLKMSDKNRVLALLELGWTYRRIERETGVRRETIAAMIRAARQKRPTCRPAQRGRTACRASPKLIVRRSRWACSKG